MAPYGLMYFQFKQNTMTQLTPFQKNLQIVEACHKRLRIANEAYDHYIDFEEYSSLASVRDSVWQAAVKQAAEIPPQNLEAYYQLTFN